LARGSKNLSDGIAVGIPIIRHALREHADSSADTITPKEMRRVVRSWWKLQLFTKQYAILLKKGGSETGSPYIRDVQELMRIVMDSHERLMRNFCSRFATGQWALDHVPGMGPFFTAFLLAYTWDGMGRHFRRPEHLCQYMGVFLPKPARRPRNQIIRTMNYLIRHSLFRVAIYQKKDPWYSFFNHRKEIENRRNEEGAYRDLAQRLVDCGYLRNLPSASESVRRLSSGRLTPYMLSHRVKKLGLRIFLEQFYTLAMLEKGKIPVDPYPVRVLGFDPYFPVEGIDSFLDNLGKDKKGIRSRIIQGPFQLGSLD